MNQNKLNALIGKNIKKYRLLTIINGKCMTQEKLAEEINVSVSLISSLESSKTKKEEEKEEKKKIEVKEIEESIEDKRMSKFTKLLIILVSVLVFALLAVFIIFPAVFKNPSIEVPDVSGLSVKEARTLLKNEGLKISGTIKEDYTDDVEAGKVTKTNPKAGSVVKKGAVITLYKSLGSNRIELKDYTGEEAEKIKWDLDKEGINVIIEKKDVDNKSDYLDKSDIIIAQEPAAGEKIISGDILKLYIPNIITAYPNFVEDSKYKSSIDKIQAFCDEYDINLTVKEVETEEKAAGTILSQSISEGSKINKGDKITVELAKKPVELVPIVGESENSNEQNNQDS